MLKSGLSLNIFNTFDLNTNIRFVKNGQSIAYDYRKKLYRHVQKKQFKAMVPGKTLS